MEVINTTLRRIPKGNGSYQYEVVLNGKLIDWSISKRRDFHAALLGQSTDGRWHSINFFGRPDLLASGLRKVQRTLTWPWKLVVATMPTLEEQAQAFNERYPLGSAVTYQDDQGNQHQTTTRSEAWHIPSNAVLVKLNDCPTYQFQAGGYDIDRVSPSKAA